MARDALLSRGAGRFVRVVADLMGPDWTIKQTGERPWASVTFDGIRVRATWRRTGQSDPRPPADLCAAIERHDYGVGRYLVADVTAKSVTAKDVMAKGGDGTLSIEALLIAQA